MLNLKTKIFILKIYKIIIFKTYGPYLFFLMIFFIRYYIIATNILKYEDVDIKNKNYYNNKFMFVLFFKRKYSEKF